MFAVILFMLTGIAAGYLVRKRKFRFINGIIMMLIWALLLLLGIEVGLNQEIVSRFHQLGFEAFLIAFFGTLGSIVGAKILWGKSSQQQIQSEETQPATGIFSVLKGSLIILAFFIIGLLAGIFKIIPEAFFNRDFSFYVLCALMFSVGLSIGQQPETVKKFRSIHSRVLLLPFVTILGTWLGVFVISGFFKHSATEFLAMSSGFGYYSLSSIMITEYKGIELGTIALLSNIIREVLTLLFAPFMVRYFGRLAPIAAGGATTMDTTFPIIVNTSGKEFSIVSIYSGFVVDFSVPFLVTLWCGF